jgi:hypothetical protein
MYVYPLCFRLAAPTRCACLYDGVKCPGGNGTRGRSFMMLPLLLQGDGGESDVSAVRDSEDESDAEGVEANVGGALVAGHDSGDEGEDEGGVSGGLKVSDIDAFWLQRSLSKFYPDANVSQRYAEVRHARCGFALDLCTVHCVHRLFTGSVPSLLPFGVYRRCCKFCKYPTIASAKTASHTSWASTSSSSTS